MPRADHELNNVIRWNINTGAYEVIVNHRYTVLDPDKMTGDELVDFLVREGIPISYLGLSEASPMKWFDITRKPTEAEINERDHIEIVYRRGAPTRRLETLPKTYYRLRTEIPRELFDTIMKGTEHRRSYPFGNSTFYERVGKDNTNVILELREIMGKRMYYLYPYDVDMSKITEEIEAYPPSFSELLAFLKRSYGSSDWLEKEMNMGDWEKIEKAILYRNLFLTRPQLEIIINEYRRRYKSPPPISMNFLIRYRRELEHWGV